MGNTDRRKWISAGSCNVGGFLSGHQKSYAPPFDIRQRRRVHVEPPLDAQRHRFAAGRVRHQPRQLAADIQLHDPRQHAGPDPVQRSTRRWSTNLRFNWLRSAATGLYVVYNDTEAFNGLGPVNRAFIIKYSHIFDVLR